MLGVWRSWAGRQAQELWQLYAVFVLVGLVSAMSLYEAAFAVCPYSPGQRHEDWELGGPAGRVARRDGSRLFYRLADPCLPGHSTLVGAC